MNVGMITCTYFMRIYNYVQPEGFNWGEMSDKWRNEFHYEDFLALAREIRRIGFNAMEIWEPMFSYRVYTHEEARRMAQDLRALGFENLAYCIGGWGAQDVDAVEPAYAFAHEMGCKVAVGCLIKRDAEVLLPVLQRVGEQYDMVYAIENHPEPNVEKPQDVAELCARFPLYEGAVQ